MGVSGGVFMEAPVPKGAPKKGQKPVRSNISEPLPNCALCSVQLTADSLLIGVYCGWRGSQAFALREDEEKEMMGKILTTDIVDFLDDADIPGTKNSSPCACSPFSTSDLIWLTLNL